MSNPFGSDPFRIGTRGSPLAMTQAWGVLEALRKRHPRQLFALHVIKTRGDRIQDEPLHQLGSTGLFSREIEAALRSEEVDVAVHCLKDLPAEMRPGLMLGAVPEREDPRDALICPAGHRLAELPDHATVATGALRRRAQLLAMRPDLKLEGIRGNLDTRLRKVRELDHLDATMVGAAGLSRMGWLDRATELVEPEVMLPAGGQGALGIQIRAGDDRTAELVAPLNHDSSERATAAERAFLGRLGAGCQVPVAVHARMDGERLFCAGLVAGMDGTPLIRDGIDGSPADAEAMGRELGQRLLDRGARRVLQELGAAPA